MPQRSHWQLISTVCRFKCTRNLEKKIAMSAYNKYNYISKNVRKLLSSPIGAFDQAVELTVNF